MDILMCVCELLNQKRTTVNSLTEPSKNSAISYALPLFRTIFYSFSMLALYFIIYFYCIWYGNHLQFFVNFLTTYILILSYNPEMFVSSRENWLLIRNKPVYCLSQNQISLTTQKSRKSRLYFICIHNKRVFMRITAKSGINIKVVHIQ